MTTQRQWKQRIWELVFSSKYATCGCWRWGREEEMSMVEESIQLGRECGAENGKLLTATVLKPQCKNLKKKTKKNKSSSCRRLLSKRHWWRDMNPGDRRWKDWYWSQLCVYDWNQVMNKLVILQRPKKC